MTGCLISMPLPRNLQRRFYQTLKETCPLHLVKPLRFVKGLHEVKPLRQKVRSPFAAEALHTAKPLRVMRGL